MQTAPQYVHIPSGTVGVVYSEQSEQVPTVLIRVTSNDDEIISLQVGETFVEISDNGSLVSIYHDGDEYFNGIIG